jgi:ATP-binding cassette subfamily B protein
LRQIIRNRLTAFKYFVSYLKPYKRYFILLISLFLALGAFTFFTPILTKNLVDKGVNRKDVDYVLLILVAQLFLFVGSAFIEIARTWILLRINNGFNTSILYDFFSKLMNLPISFFDRKAVGDLQQRITDNYKIQNFFTSNSISLLVSCVSLLAYLLTLAYFNWQILVIILLFSVIGSLWIMYFQKERKRLNYDKFYAMGHNQDQILELIVGMQEIKHNNCEQKKIDKWLASQSQLMQLNIGTIKVEQKQILGSTLLNQLEGILISFISAYEVINGKMSLGTMMSISMIAGQLKGVINQLLFFLRAFQDASISVDRLMEIHEKKNEDEDRYEKRNELYSQDLLLNELRLENVSYTYDGNNVPVLRNISLTIQKGQTLAIVGSSGSGKTTLLKLLLKYYKPQTGIILVNDTIQLKSIRSDLWRRKCGVVMQDGYIFSDSIAENICLFDKTVDYEKMKKSAQIANILQFIESLPDKWETKIGSKGTGISGGQRQRILIARAIYKCPELLFFDEATSSLDSENERIIIDNISRQLDTTKIIIAHKFSTIKNADQIVVLDDGEVIEVGDHLQLMDRKGKYYQLFMNQLSMDESGIAAM